MPEDTSKLLGLIDEIATIGGDCINTDGIISVYVNRHIKPPMQIHLDDKAMDKLLAHYADKAQLTKHDAELDRKSIMFFDTVEVFCLIPRLVEEAG